MRRAREAEERKRQRLGLAAVGPLPRATGRPEAKVRVSTYISKTPYIDAHCRCSSCWVSLLQRGHLKFTGQLELNLILSESVSVLVLVPLTELSCQSPVACPEVVAVIISTSKMIHWRHDSASVSGVLVQPRLGAGSSLLDPVDPEELACARWCMSVLQREANDYEWDTDPQYGWEDSTTTSSD
jgi:hypothetical protein